MRSRSVVVGLMLLCAPTAGAAVLPEAQGVPGGIQLPAVEHPHSTSMPTTYLQEGDRAPGFSYLDPHGDWRSFDRLLEAGPVLLVFGASEEDIRGIERQHAAFVELGAVPVVAMDRKFGSTQSVARKLSMESTAISDPRGSIASLFNSVDPLTHRHAQSYFLLDGSRRVLKVEHGHLPHALQLVAAVARGLGKPLPEAAATLSARTPTAR